MPKKSTKRNVKQSSKKPTQGFEETARRSNENSSMNMNEWIEKAENFLAHDDNEAELRYRKYKTKDPFPDIPPSLLNSADIFKYVKETGMIFPFWYRNKDDESVEDKNKESSSKRKIVGAKGATFPIKIGDQCIYWDNENIRREVDLKKGSFTLRKNSIAFVELEPMFRVPDYIVLRFNLKIKHVYKGLLLGTGPVVDPGFCGKLYIPLHNLTNNDYEFFKGDELIEMEFTKLSHNSLWLDSSVRSEKTQNHSNVMDGYYFSFPHKDPRKFNEYLSNALRDSLKSDKTSSKNEYVEIINNSIPLEIQEQTKKLEEFENKLDKSEEDIKNELRNSENFRNFGLVAASLTILGLLVSIFGVHFSETNRHDGLLRDVVRLEKEYNSSLEKIETTEKEKNALKEKLDRLEKEFNKLKNEVELIERRVK